jgi:hypothetical protein
MMAVSANVTNVLTAFSGDIALGMLNQEDALTVALTRYQHAWGSRQTLPVACITLR